MADLTTNLVGENTQAKPWSQDALEDLCLLLHRERDEPAAQFGDLDIIGLGWKGHRLASCRSVSWPFRV